MKVGEINIRLKFKNIIFDMDGTLLDSSNGVLNSLRQVFIDNNVVIKKTISKKIIGPPLRETIVQLTEIIDEKKLDHLVDCFKCEYDSEGYKDTTIFKDIDVMISSLYEHGINLYIATNKRQNPTKKIINMLDLGHFFTGIYSIDSFGSGVETKGELLAHLVQIFNLEDCIYIGDHIDDFHAANYAKLEYMMVDWGFGTFINEFNWELVLTPKELVRNLGNK